MSLQVNFETISRDVLKGIDQWELVPHNSIDQSFRKIFPLRTTQVIIISWLMIVNVTYPKLELGAVSQQN